VWSLAATELLVDENSPLRRVPDAMLCTSHVQRRHPPVVLDVAPITSLVAARRVLEAALAPRATLPETDDAWLIAALSPAARVGSPTQSSRHYVERIVQSLVADNLPVTFTALL
jgi:hypothetical protein